MLKEDGQTLVLNVKDLTLPVINRLGTSAMHQINKDGQPVIVVTDDKDIAAVQSQLNSPASGVELPVQPGTPTL